MFASVLGLAGLGLAWREAAGTFGFTLALSDLFLGFAAGFYIAVLALYGLKAYRHPDATVDDFNDPIRGCYFSAAGMGLLLLSSAAAPHSMGLAEALWIIGAPVNLAITIAIVHGWMSREFHMHHATPIWFLPIAGNLLAAIAAPQVGYGEAGWMIFAVGLVFWFILQVIIFYRLLFHEPMEQPLRPTIVIMLAPPSLAAVAYQVLTGGALFGAAGGFATMLYGLALFIGALLILQIPMLMRLPFGLSSWSYTFPLSAFTVTATLYADRHPHWLADVIAIAGLAASTLITFYIFAKTAKMLIAGNLFREAPTPIIAAEAED
jgi:tellurite resistance protein